MNYDRLSKLAGLLNTHFGQPNKIGFVVAPEHDLLLAEHKKAIVHSDRMFDYTLEDSERLGIISLRRQEDAGNVAYDHTRLEHMDHAALSNEETTAMLQEYMEHKKTQIMEY